MRFYYGSHPMADMIVNYNNAMEPESYTGSSQNPGSEPPNSDLGVQDIGMSVPLGISAQNISGIYAKIRAGAGNIELGFPGAIRGQRQAQTPEMYGKEHRQAIRELGAINEVNFTTHSSYGIMGLSGFTGDNPYNVWFQKEYKKQAVDEIKRAIEFARDTAGGGSVVVHTGEVERPISDQPWATDSGRFLFKQYEDEAELSRIRVVDDRTGQVTQVRKNIRIYRPKWKRADHDYEGEDTEGKKVSITQGDYIDYLNRKIPYKDIFSTEKGRVPEYDDKTGRFVDEPYDWDRMKKETVERNKWRAWKLGKKVEELTEDERVDVDEIHVRSSMETQEGHSRGWSMQYGVDTQRHIEHIKKIRKALEYYRVVEKKIPKEEHWKIQQMIPAQMRDYVGGLIPPDAKNPVEILERALTTEERNLLFSRQASDSQLLQAEDTAEHEQHMVSAHKYAVKEAVKGYAEAGIHAMDCTIDNNRPITITMENIFPERYGGHPQELKELILKSREEMVKRLTEPRIPDPAGIKEGDNGKVREIENPWYRGMSKEQAWKEAEDHVKATLDTGHLNLWKKYWQDDPKKTREQNDADFRNWTLKEVEDLAKNKMIGNVHLTDNFGYQDDHLAPGQGNTPVKEIVSILRKHGYDKSWTVEPGADASTDVSDFHGLMRTWRHFGSPIYGVGMAVQTPQTWTDVHYSYFGQNQPPYFIFPPYAPSNDWTLWTATPLE